jgi:hypothetical protein
VMKGAGYPAPFESGHNRYVERSPTPACHDRRAAQVAQMAWLLMLP